MSSNSGSDNESNRSDSPVNNGPAPTPGHRSRSASNSPGLNKSQASSPERAESRTSHSRSGSPASSARSRSSSPSAKSNKSLDSEKSAPSRKSRSRSVVSNRSRSAGSNRSGSVASNKSNNASQRSGSGSPAGSNRSRSGSSGSKRSRSGSVGSKRSRSGSASSKRSRSGSAGSRKSRSGSAGSKRSRSRSDGSKRSRSGSANSKRSRSGSPASQRSRSRSGSAASNRSGSRSPTRSRSASAGSNRSKSGESHRSRSAESNRSRHSGSRSCSPSQDKRLRSKSNSPDLQIDEPGSPDSNTSASKRKRADSEEKIIKKKSRKIESDSEGEGKEDGKGVSAAAIFGDDADDISSEEEKGDKADSDREVHRSEDEERHSEEENEERQGEEAEDKENEPEPIPETRIDVEIPKISCDLGRDIHFVKLPNFLSVETRPFDPETYEDEIDEEETLDEEGRARLKLKVENTIRWKEMLEQDGNMKRQSNARLVRWSDGSYSLHLGSEIFDVYKQPLQGDHNHLFIRQGTGLQGQAVFRTKLSFRPHSTESFTHRKMTLSLADRSQKTSGIKILSQVGADPDQDRKLLLKKEEEKLRQTVRVSKPRRRGDALRPHNTSAYREEEGSDEEGAISLNAIKNKYKSGAAASAKGGAIYSSDEEGSDIEARRARKLDKAKVLKDSDSNEESE